MQLLTRALGVRRAIEIGTFTGFSALCIARGLPDDGSLLCLDRNEEWTAVARRYWERAGLADRIELRLGDALPTLRSLPAEEPPSTSRSSTRTRPATRPTWTELYPRMRPNGVVLLDNTLRTGRVLDPETDDDRALVDAERRPRRRPALGDRAAADGRRADHAAQAMSAPDPVRTSFAVRVSRPDGRLAGASCSPTTPVTSCRCWSARWASPAPTAGRRRSCWSSTRGCTSSSCGTGPAGWCGR